MKPTIAIPNIFGKDAERLASFARRHGIGGIEWSLDPLDFDELPGVMQALEGFEVRFHARFFGVDLAYNDHHRSNVSMKLFRSAADHAASSGKSYLTIHIGLGHSSMGPLSWKRALENLAALADHGAENGVTVCLENLATGWTSDPDLFSQLIRYSGARVTLDIGHAHAAGEGLDRIFRQFFFQNRERIAGAHIYHTEIDGIGHVPPGDIDDIRTRLDLLSLCGCRWWVIELFSPGEVLQARQLLEEYFDERESQVEGGADQGYSSFMEGSSASV